MAKKLRTYTHRQREADAEECVEIVNSAKRHLTGVIKTAREGDCAGAQHDLELTLNTIQRYAKACPRMDSVGPRVGATIAELTPLCKRTLLGPKLRGRRKRTHGGTDPSWLDREMAHHGPVRKPAGRMGYGLKVKATASKPARRRR